MPRQLRLEQIGLKTHRLHRRTQFKKAERSFKNEGEEERPLDVPLKGRRFWVSPTAAFLGQSDNAKAPTRCQQKQSWA